MNVTRKVPAVTLVAAVLVGACGGGGGGGGSGGGVSGYCTGAFLGGSTGWSCLGGCAGVDPLDNVDDFDVAIDDKASTFRGFGLDAGGSEITISATAHPGTEFPSGANSGVLMQFPEGVYAQIGVTFNTYLDGVPVDSQVVGATASGGTVDGAGSPKFYGFTATGSYNRLESTVRVAGNTDRTNFQVHEFCGDK